MICFKTVVTVLAFLPHVACSGTSYEEAKEEDHYLRAPEVLGDERKLPWSTRQNFPIQDVFGNNLFWDMDSGGGLQILGNNGVSPTLKVANSRDAGGPKAPVLEVLGRDEGKLWDKADPMIKTLAVEGNTGIELNNGDIYGYTLFNMETDELVIREVKKQGNFDLFYFYKLVTKNVLLDGGGSAEVKVFESICPTRRNKKDDCMEVRLGIQASDKECAPACWGQTDIYKPGTNCGTLFTQRSQCVNFSG